MLMVKKALALAILFISIAVFTLLTHLNAADLALVMNRGETELRLALGLVFLTNAVAAFTALILWGNKSASKAGSKDKH